MKMLLILGVLLCITSSAKTDPRWELVGSRLVIPGDWKSGTWNVSIDKNSETRSGQTIHGTFWLDFSASPKCYPSVSDCRWKVVHSYETYNIFCNGTVQSFDANVAYDPSYSDTTSVPTYFNAGGQVIALDSTMPISIAVEQLCK